ncbi:MAG: hypothetical protein RR515_03915 [Clostridium sp.]
MKQGMVYVESLMVSLITIILIVSISKLVFTASKIVEGTKDKGRAFDIVRSVSSLYKANKSIITNERGIGVSNSADIYEFIENGITKNQDADFTVYTINSFEEGIKILKIKIVSNNQGFKDISMVVTK